MRPLLFALSLTACTGAPTPQAPAPTASSLEVVALSQPAGWLASALVGDAGQVTVMVPAGEDPPHWRPEPAAIASLSEADLIVANGAGYEPWIATASVPRDRLVVTAKGLDLIEREGVTHAHGDAGSHHHGATDPHTWLDPLLYLGQAQAIHRHLVAALPDVREAFDARLEDLRTRILAVDAHLKTQLSGLDAVSFAANHPSYDYLARRYDLSVHTIAIEPDTVPDEATVGQVSAWFTAHRADQGPPPVMLWESAAADTVRGALPGELRHVVVDPVEQPEDGVYDWDARVRAAAAVLHSLVPPTEGK